MRGYYHTKGEKAISGWKPHKNSAHLDQMPENGPLHDSQF
jgi:hypothetical protein